MYYVCTMYVVKTKVLLSCGGYHVADLLFFACAKAGFLMTRLIIMLLVTLMITLLLIKFTYDYKFSQYILRLVMLSPSSSETKRKQKDKLKLIILSHI